MPATVSKVRAVVVKPPLGGNKKRSVVQPSLLRSSPPVSSPPAKRRRPSSTVTSGLLAEVSVTPLPTSRPALPTNCVLANIQPPVSQQPTQSPPFEPSPDPYSLPPDFDPTRNWTTLAAFDESVFDVLSMDSLLEDTPSYQRSGPGS